LFNLLTVDRTDAQTGFADQRGKEKKEIQFAFGIQLIINSLKVIYFPYYRH